MGYQQSFPTVVPRLKADSLHFTHPSATFLWCKHQILVRLACIKHAASVRPEPGSNSPLSESYQSLLHPCNSFQLITSLARLSFLSELTSSFQLFCFQCAFQNKLFIFKLLNYLYNQGLNIRLTYFVQLTTVTRFPYHIT